MAQSFSKLTPAVLTGFGRHCAVDNESCVGDDLCCRQPGAHAHTQSAAGSSRSAPAGSQAPFVNLQDTFDECVGSISEAGAAFHNTLCLDDAQAGVGADVLRSWADPDSQK